MVRGRFLLHAFYILTGSGFLISACEHSASYDYKYCSWLKS